MTDLTKFPKRVRKAKWIEKYKPKPGDGICPGFWKGCPGTWGCPWRCSYCFLARYRFMPDPKLNPDEVLGCRLYPLVGESTVARENRVRFHRESMKLWPEDVPDGERDPVPPAFINWGETADSLACESETGFLRHIMPWAQDRDFDLPIHLLLTKSAGDGWLDWVLGQEPTDKIIFSFSVTQRSTYQLYEEVGGAPPVRERWETMHALASKGWRVRARIDPLRWWDDSEAAQRRAGIEETKRIADACVHPAERITLGTFRFAGPHPLVKELGMTRSKEDPRWRLRYDRRVELYKAAADAIDGRCEVGLCKETEAVWTEVFGYVPKAHELKCNCTA